MGFGKPGVRVVTVRLSSGGQSPSPGSSAYTGARFTTGVDRIKCTLDACGIDGGRCAPAQRAAIPEAMRAASTAARSTGQMGQIEHMEKVGQLGKAYSLKCLATSQTSYCLMSGCWSCMLRTLRTQVGEGTSLERSMRGFMLGWSRMFEVRTSNSKRKRKGMRGRSESVPRRHSHSMAKWTSAPSRRVSGRERTPNRESGSPLAGSVLEEFSSMYPAD